VISTADLKLGGPQDCPTNPNCLAGLKDIYGVDLSEATSRRSMAAGPNTKRALKNGNIDVAVLFSSDGAIAANDWVVLEDDKGLLEGRQHHPGGVKSSSPTPAATIWPPTVDEVSGTLTTDKLVDLNKRFDIDKDDAEDIAKDYLAEEGLN
jgi:osmoprotectant transport system substrate-binding protein